MANNNGQIFVTNPETGQSLKVSAAAKLIGRPPETIYQRVRTGWTNEQIFELEPRPGNRAALPKDFNKRCTNRMDEKAVGRACHKEYDYADTFRERAKKVALKNGIFIP